MLPSQSLPVLSGRGAIPLIGNGFLHPALTFSRASGATYANGAGVLQSVLNDVPRYPNGLGRLLIEGTRTNLITDARTVGGTGWTVGGVTSAAPTTGPDGGATSGMLLTEDTGSSFHATSINNPFAVTLSTPYAFTAIVAPGTCSNVQITWAGTAGGAQNFVNFVLSGAGSIGTMGSSVSAPTITRLSTGFYVLQALFSGGATSSTSSMNILFGQSSSDPRLASFVGTGRTMTVSWFDMQQAAFPSTVILPPIGTPGVSTRAADNLSVLLASLGLSPTGFTLSGRCLLPQVAAFQTIFQADAAADANRYCLFNQTGTSNIQGLRTTAGSQVNGAVTGAMVAGTTFGWAMSINLAAGTASYCMQSGTVQTLVGGPTSGITTLRFGNVAGSGAGAMFGSISASARPYIVPDAALPALAAGAL